MNVSELRECPIFQARPLMYVRFNANAGPFVQYQEVPITNELHLTFADEVENSTLEGWLVETNGLVTSMYSVGSHEGDALVFFDSVQNFTPGNEMTISRYVTVGSDNEKVAAQLMEKIEGFFASPDLFSQTWFDNKRMKDE
jgi:hypothetical protein